MYSSVGRPSLPPERLLKAQLVIALFSVRSGRLLCEMVDYNILFGWLLDMPLDEPALDNSTFGANRDRLLQQQVAPQFFTQVVGYAREAVQAAPHTHKHLTTTIEKIESGLMWFKPMVGMRRQTDLLGPVLGSHREHQC